MKKVKIEKYCPFCEQPHSVEVDVDDYNKFLGDNDTRVFTYLNDDEKEILLTGICKECWDNMFNIDDEEEYLFD